MATNCYDITYLIWEASVTGKRFYRWKNVRYDERGDALNGRMMDNDIDQLIDSFLKKQNGIGRVYFAGEMRSPAEPVVQVDFPRLHIILNVCGKCKPFTDIFQIILKVAVRDKMAIHQRIGRDG